MENKINIAELLKDCPKGMELDCTMFDNVKFISVEEGDKPICIRTDDIYRYLTKFGTWTFDDNAKCVIFPKGKTTWEGFHRPFKDGDIVAGKNYACSYITIFRKFINDGSFSHHVCLTSFGTFKFGDISDNANLRFATKEEKQKLFDAIKAKGYKWNPETKTLKKLEQPKFDISTLKPFDKVLVRDSDRDMWCASIFSHTWKDKYFCIDTWHKQCIPYEANKELLGTTNNPKEHGSK